MKIITGKCLNWLMQASTILIMTDPHKGTTPSKYWPFTCLSTIYTLPSQYMITVQKGIGNVRANSYWLTCLLPAWSCRYLKKLDTLTPTYWQTFQYGIHGSDKEKKETTWDLLFQPINKRNIFPHPWCCHSLNGATIWWLFHWDNYYFTLRDYQKHGNSIMESYASQ